MLRGGVSSRAQEFELKSRTVDTPDIRLGTSAFTAAGWEGTFYPAGMKPADFLSYYATKFDTVEVDSTFYRTPAISTVKGWYAKTPPGFLFAAKVPQLVTHEKMLADCDEEFHGFLRAMDNLGEKLGPMLLQFGYFNKQAFSGVQDFLARLVPFLKKIPREYRFALEIRNKYWLVPAFVDVLREHNVALALIDQSWMPGPKQQFARIDPITSDFAYVRWLGDRKGIELQTKVWDKTILDRTAELGEWVDVLRKVRERRIPIQAYANNHYAGYGPGTIEQFRKLWQSATP
ncbi:MAG TPA: DUF72 domain-containing protein [Candidatus Acidoferrales bacterium]|jgi:uncharacterized protein YecE (DUF72 family)|nr:DUF72 domain-containing protein [Candidatus Acidoferrales bacterium]